MKFKTSRWIKPSRLGLAAMFAAALLTTSCKEDEEDNSAVLLLALAAAGQPNCFLGTVGFQAVGPSCDGTRATGAGTLTASAPHGRVLSLQFDLTVPSGGGVILHGQASAGLTSAGTFTFANAGNVGAKGPTGTLTATTITGGTGTYCAEIHDDDGNTHLILAKAVCSPTPGVSWNSDAAALDPAAAGAVAGKNWGFTVTGADTRISNLSLLTSIVFAD